MVPVQEPQPRLSVFRASTLSGALILAHFSSFPCLKNPTDWKKREEDRKCVCHTWRVSSPLFLHSPSPPPPKLLHRFHYATRFNGGFIHIHFRFHFECFALERPRHTLPGAWMNFFLIIFLVVFSFVCFFLFYDIYISSVTTHMQIFLFIRIPARRYHSFSLDIFPNHFLIIVRPFFLSSINFCKSKHFESL